MEKCPYCNGSKHIFISVGETKKLVRCRCLIKEQYESKLSKFNLLISPIAHLIDEKGFRFSEDQDGKFSSKICTIYSARRSPKKQIILNCAISITRVQFILSSLVASIDQKDIKYCDITDFINNSFNNEKILLKRVNIVSILYSSSKQLKEKFIQDLSLQARLENKILIYVVDNFRELKRELPSLALFFSSENTLVAPQL